jgi:hydrogenase nickel incorporation protein HypB
MQRVEVEAPVLRKNSEVAEENRALFSQLGVFVLNLMSAPGAGKTTLLEKTLPLFKQRLRVAVIEGDLHTSLDADRISKVGVPARQINTRMCHLDASLVREAFTAFEDEPPQLLIIENIGNLVCPASYDLGEHVRVTLFSVAEGADKPTKYPRMFHLSHAVVLNKLDLAPHCDISVPELIENVRNVSPTAEIFPVSCRTGEGLTAWVEWVLAQACERT